MWRVIGVLAVIAATIAALVECVQTPSPRLLPRWTWAIVILVLPVLGPVGWFFLGRLGRRSATRPVASPDDDARFIRSLDDEVWKRKQQRRRGLSPE